MLGMLGGGQLGCFFAIAARQLGYRVTVWDPNPAAPAASWATHFIHASFSDRHARHEFARSCVAGSYEWENVPLSLVEALEKEMPFRPGSRILSLSQNRMREKSVLKGAGFPLAPYRPVKEKQALHEAAQSLGLPVILKCAEAGYDGQGQWRLKSQQDVARLGSELQTRPSGWVLEKQVPYLKELSIVAARDEAGHFVAYPVTENTHDRGILRYALVPADINASLSDRIAQLAKVLLEALEAVGLFCLELFLLEEEQLLINELAPRPHNSGHYSLDVCSVSQFEQQLRVLCGLPPAEPLLSSPAVLLNLLGAEILALRSRKHLEALLEIPGLKVYDYGKTKISPRRKMGHLLIRGAQASGLAGQAGHAQSILGEAARLFG